MPGVGVTPRSALPARLCCHLLRGGDEHLLHSLGRELDTQLDVKSQELSERIGVGMLN